MTSYREFHVLGSGYEITSESSRDRPRLILDQPLLITKFNVKSVELPLTFSQLVQPTDYVFTTTYKMQTSGFSVAFRDYIVFSSNEIVTGALILSKMQTLLIAHGSTTFAGHLAATSGFSNNGVDPAAKLSTTTTAVVSLTGVPQFSFTRALAIAGAAPVDTNVLSVTINLIPQSRLASLFDYPYWGSASIVVNTVSGPNLVSVDSALPTMFTRPSYLLLHSNLRAGFHSGSTGRPDSSTYDTIIAKIDIQMDSTQTWGTTSAIWINPSQHPDLFYKANDSEYSELDFWMTYPDGTFARFSGNSFSLTLACIVSTSF